MSVAIKTENLTKVYKKAKAVDSINIEVKKGDVCGFVGPNGAGKTTTIGMLTGMIEPSEGRCFVNDIEVTKHPIEVKRVIGYMPDGFGFYGHMNATRNLKYFARLYGIEGAAAEAKISVPARNSGPDEGRQAHGHIFQGHAAAARPGPGTDQ